MRGSYEGLHGVLDIKDGLGSFDKGIRNEAKVADFLQSQGESVEGMGVKIKNVTTDKVAGDLDVLTDKAVIEVKSTFNSFKHGQVDKFSNLDHPNFLNPHGKKPILYIDEAMTEAQRADILSKIPADVTLVNSLEELAQALN